MLCRYKSVVESTYGYSMSKEAAEVAALTRIDAARVALMYDPEIFGQEDFNVTVNAGDFDETASASMIVLGADENGVWFEIVGSKEGE